MVWIYIKSDNGQNIPENLFLLLMRNPERVPKLEKVNEVGRKKFRVVVVVKQFTLMLYRE